MRILHVANFSYVSARRKRADNAARYYAPDHKIGRGLTRNGHCTWQFSYRDIARFLSPLGMGKKLGAGKMNQQLIADAKAFAPDLLLLGHAEIVSPDAIAAIRNNLPKCRVAQWWVDPFSDYAVQHLRAKMPLLDAFFCTTAPSYARARIAAPAGNMPPVHYLPNIIDAAAEDQRAHAAAAHDYDVLFIGGDSPGRTPLLERLQRRMQAAGIRCGFFGFGGRRKLSGREFVAAFGKSKMGLNLSAATNIPLYSSDRIAQITGNGCLALMPRTPQMHILYNEQEAAYYDGEEELLALAQKFCGNDQDWRQVAKAGWRRAHNSYNERRVTRFMLQAAMGEDFSEQYEWLAAE